MTDEDQDGSTLPLESAVPTEPTRGSTQEPNTGLSQQTFWQTSEGGEALEHAWSLLTDLVRSAPSVHVKIKLSYQEDPPITMSYGHDDEDEDLEDAYTEAGGTLEDLEAHPT